MYIIELILKKLREKKNKRKVVSTSQVDDFSDYEQCEHVFMPIDSTGKIFACSKCGQILKK